MNAYRPEAESEYSTRPEPGSGLRRARAAAGGLAIVGAAALLAAEWLVLQRVVTVARRPTLVRAVTTGPHDGWALVPIAVLTLVLIGAAWRTGRPRAAFGAVTALGLIALVVAVLVDRRGLHAVGAVVVAGDLRPAQVQAGIGLYVETLGGVLLVAGGAAGALLSGRRDAASPPANRAPTHRQQSAD